MQTSSLRRQMKNMVNNYTEAEIKVREATSNDPWGPPTSLMCEIADLTFNVLAFTEVMGMIWKRLNDHGKNWRHVYKALALMDYLIKTGSERVAQDCRENVYSIQTLRDFQYVDRDGRDQGVNVREKAKNIVALLRDEEKLKKERAQALKTKTRMAGSHSAMGSGSQPPPYPGRRSSSSYVDEYGRCSPSSGQPASRLAPDLEQARPATSGEEELQLQLALAMSREESEKPPPPTVAMDEQAQLKIAMKLSQREVKKPVPRPAPQADMDEDTQLQLALSMSKEEHKQEQLSRQGDETMLQKALEESKRALESKGGTAFMDLVDIFAVPSEPPPSEYSWNEPRFQASGRAEPWDPHGAESRGEPAWMAPPPSNSPPPPWEPSQPLDNPWDSPQRNLNSAGGLQAFPSNTAVDPFSAPSDRRAREPSPRTGSPTDGDLFDEAMDGGRVNINGGDRASPEMFDLSRLGEGLPIAAPRACRTPESFLDPLAASLVDLDSLIPANPAAKTKNPFLSGLSAPPTTNPFQADQGKLTLNQMGSGSGSATPNNSSLPYSASLPLPTSQQPSSLPSSLTHPTTQPGLDLLVTLPEPLLPFSGGSAQGTLADQNNQNPFL